MKKFTELLCEYEKTKENHLRWFIEYLVWWWYRFMYYDFTKKWNVKEILAEDEAVSKAISQSYWFIKRLVEKDKIDRAKFWNSETKSSKYSDFELSYNTPREDYTNILLMELAIQDEPINFLISILKMIWMLLSVILKKF